MGKCISKDLQLGKAAGQFSFERLSTATDFLMGASVRGIQAIRQGVADPNGYINAAVKMALTSVGCSREYCDERSRILVVVFEGLGAWGACSDQAALGSQLEQYQGRPTASANKNKSGSQGD